MSEALTGAEFKKQLREGKPKMGLVSERAQPDGGRTTRP